MVPGNVMGSHVSAAPRPGLTSVLSGAPASSKQMKKQGNDGEKQKQVNQTCTYMENQETACPQQQKNKEDCYEHGRLPRLNAFH
jgi:hypothetical protein